MGLSGVRGGRGNGEWVGREWGLSWERVGSESGESGERVGRGRGVSGVRE